MPVESSPPSLDSRCQSELSMKVEPLNRSSAYRPMAQAFHLNRPDPLDKVGQSILDGDPGRGRNLPPQNRDSRASKELHRHKRVPHASLSTDPKIDDAYEESYK